MHADLHTANIKRYIHKTRRQALFIRDLPAMKQTIFCIFIFLRL